jgi:hypothetical protein
MREYQTHLEEYSREGSGWFSKLTLESEWGKKEIAEQYLSKYWLSQAKYDTFWKPIQNQIFINQDRSLPEIIFNANFNMLAFRGGRLFLREDFEQLQKCFLEVKDKYFVVIENTFGGKLQEPAFRMEYPTEITWEELTSGNFISSTIIESMYKEYFVFSESKIWGKYSANDYHHPLDIIGFKPEYSSLFRDKLKQSEEERQEIMEWLPPNYKELIK